MLEQRRKKVKIAGKKGKGNVWNFIFNTSDRYQCFFPCRCVLKFVDATSEFVHNTVAKEKPLCWMTYNLRQGLMLEAPQRAAKIVSQCRNWELGIDFNLSFKTNCCIFIHQSIALFVSHKKVWKTNLVKTLCEGLKSLQYQYR